MKKIFIVIIPFIFISCGTFNPGTIDRRSAATSPGSKQIDSVYVLVKQYQPREAELIFDADFRYYDFEPLYISVFNKSTKKIIVNPDSVSNFIKISYVNNKTAQKGFAYFLAWSSPWTLNLLVGWPFYYGIAWPIFGIIAGGKTSGANSRREEFYTSNSLKYTELMSGQEIDGILFIKKTKDEPIQIYLNSNDGSQIQFHFENNCMMFFK